jgi:4-alpha-glucanotransferase
MMNSQSSNNNETNRYANTHAIARYDLTKRASGVLLHVSSLPGPHGCGDFGASAFHYVDWLVAAGQRIWQILPNNPIGPGNSPYQSVSAFAGSPLMIALEPLKEKGWLTSIELPVPAFSNERLEFDRVVPWRMMYLRLAEQGFKANANKTERAAFAAYCQAQAYWLDDYALFMALDEAANHYPFWTWEAGVRSRQAAALETAAITYAAEIVFWQFVQWCFDEQAAAVKKYANDRGVYIMGDLPIFIAHHSADCWTRPDLYYLDKDFNTTVVAGVPPDDMGPLGQRWGSPLYRWDKMADENYSWWVDRMRRALEHSDIFRIDHFRGFAGYWEIPASEPTAQVGRWVTGPGKALFDAIRKALGPLPILAEDLGFITDDVHELRKYCGFPGMKILQFGFGGDGHAEFLPHNYATDAVVYTGTHDNDTAVGWWDAAHDHEKKLASIYLNTTREHLHWSMIRAASQSVAALAVFPMQDVLGLGSEHRMNTPGTMNSINWSWRLQWSMVGDEPGKKLAAISAASGRGPFDKLGS